MISPGTGALAAALCLVRRAEAQRLPGHVVDVVAGDYFFRAPDTVPAGLVTLRMRTLPNAGGHIAVLVRLAPGRHVADFIAAERAGGQSTDWARSLGGPGFPAPNGDANATLLLDPGEYALVCYLRGPKPTSKTPHYELGMYHSLIVTTPKEPATASLPTAEAEITITDSTLLMNDSIAPGTRVIRVVNRGTSAREIKLFRVLPGHTAKQSMAWKPDSGTPEPDVNVTALVDIPPGGSLTSSWALRAGTYTLFVLPTKRSPMLTRALSVATR